VGEKPYSAMPKSDMWPSVSGPDAHLINKRCGAMANTDGRTQDLAHALNLAHAAGRATAEAELDTLRNEIASLTRNDWTGTLCDRLNMIARRHGWNPCRNGEEGAALAVVVDSYCASAQAELAALRAKWEALRGECNKARYAEEVCDDETASDEMMEEAVAELKAARTLTDSTHALEADQ